jgi:hypothetical protein
MNLNHFLLTAVIGLALCPRVEPRADDLLAEQEAVLEREGTPPAREIEVSPAWGIGPGSAVILRPPSEARSEDLILHFHGAVDAVRRAMMRDDGGETVVLVNMPGLSAAYEQPFRDDPALFHSLLVTAWNHGSEPADSQPPSDWRRITLSSFSAGYGAIREILRSPASQRIDAIVAADSIYAGIDTEGTVRRVRENDMAGFLAFARDAIAGRRVFVIAHSAQPTPYASTTETADYLLAELGLRRAEATIPDHEEFAPVSRCRQDGLLVTGHAGESAAAHLHHLRIIDRHWDDARRLAGRR